ncbi:MAG TPA: hypothetical protein PKO06_24675, partial [Candidatus Ozemobacteraceae bacterium]|nr:hypothetical protein [Candidatus Ozemobacteraceae bacterium]
RGKYVSELKFSDFTVDDNIQLLPDTVTLIHKDQQGRIIPHETVSHDLDETPKSRDRLPSYRKVYDAETLPDDITEEIVCEFLIKGTRERVAFTLPIKKVARYSGYDVLMGV